MSRLEVLIIILMCSVKSSESARILAVFPTPSISHQVVFRPLTQELARRGHDVTVLTTDPVFPKGKAPANLTEIDVHDISYDMWRKTLIAHNTGKTEDVYTLLEIAFDMLYNKIFPMQLNANEFRKIIDEKQQFDLLLLEAYIRPTLILSHIFKAPVIQVSSLGNIWPNYENLGAPIHPFLYPEPFRQRYYNLNLWEKIKVLCHEWWWRTLISDFDKKHNVLNKEMFGQDTPSLHELSNNIDMLFLNTHPIWEGNMPWPPSIIHTWGIHQMPQKVLPQDIQTYLDSSKDGVIYLSFGTNVDPATFPPERIRMLISVFSKLPYNVLWKWSLDVLPGKTENIKISKWFPQSDLLRHPKVKLFITQGGLQSTDEAIVAGVPLIGIPTLGDQWFNTEKYVQYGIGLQLNIETINEEMLTNAIKEVMSNERYQNNIKKLSACMQDSNMSGLERAIWWTEYVLRHGGARHLRAPAANINWVNYYLDLELVSVIMVTLLAFISLIFIIFSICYRFITRLFTVPTGQRTKLH